MPGLPACSNASKQLGRQYKESTHSVHEMLWLIVLLFHPMAIRVLSLLSQRCFLALHSHELVKQSVTKSQSAIRSKRSCSTHFSVLVEVHFQWLHILFEAQRAHGPKQVVTVYCLSLLFGAFVASPAAAKRLGQTRMPMQSSGRSSRL